MLIRLVQVGLVQVISWLGVSTAEAEQSLKGSHRRAAAVEAEGELLQVGLKVLFADATVGALQPGLEVADHPVHAGQGLVRVLSEQPLRRRSPDSERGRGRIIRPLTMGGH